MLHIVIMAGGVGSRFWPMSTPERPKQFIDVLGCGRTLLQLTATRFGEAATPENIWVVTSRNYQRLVREQLPDVPEGNVLLEPCMRNTAPCIAYAAWKIAKSDPEATLVVTPADHIVADTDMFRRVIKQGVDFIRGTGNILTLGMRPTRPDTGYGYVQAGDETAGASGSLSSAILPVASFREKPDLETAKDYLARGGFLWNAGIFIMDASTAKRAMDALQPAIRDVMEALAPAMGTPAENDEVTKLFPDCTNISVDYAVMEPLSKRKVDGLGGIYVLPADFGWSDLGTWGSLHEKLRRDEADNSSTDWESTKLWDCGGCTVRPGGISVNAIGLRDYIVAHSNGTLLICPRSREQEIKEFRKMFYK